MRDAEQVYARDRAAWRRWLASNAEQRGGVWLVYDKGPERKLSYDAIVEEALCVGWVDSTARSLSETQAMLYVAPRKPTSGWSRPNKERVERLLAAGRMRPAGIAAVEEAKRRGSWTALDDAERLIEPPELVAALDAAPTARANWDGFPPSARRAILGWISLAKRPETRQRRIAETVAEAAEGRRANDWSPPGRA